MRLHINPGKISSYFLLRNIHCSSIFYLLLWLDRRFSYIITIYIYFFETHYSIQTVFIYFNIQRVQKYCLKIQIGDIIRANIFIFPTALLLLYAVFWIFFGRSLLLPKQRIPQTKFKCITPMLCFLLVTFLFLKEK